jgi:serine phosphatase RsbU (regulator of sigma subunit)
MTETEIEETLDRAWNGRRSDMRGAFHEATSLLSFCETNGFEKSLADCHKILGYCYWRFSDFSASMEHSLEALTYFQTTNDLRGEADTLNSLGAVYMFEKEHQKRLECNLKCLEIRKILGNPDDISGSMNNIGETYLEMGDLESAKAWFEDCISYPGSSEDSVAWARHNLGKLYYIEQDFALSETNYIESLRISLSIDYHVLTTETYIHISQLYQHVGYYDSALEFGLKALNLAQATGAKEEQKNAHLLLSEIKEGLGDVAGAFENYKRYHKLFTEIHNESNTQKLKDIQFQFELENVKKEAEIERLKTVELKAAYDQIGIQKALLEQRNKEIVESIRYAQRIQRAVLKEENYTQTHLPEHFIYYKPKDIVSGDFYWAKEKDGVLYIAAADCTGHGVPGGFLTMLGISFLNEIISKNDVVSPAQILNELRDKFIKELQLHDASNDGMDITLVSLHYDEQHETKHVTWAGAYNPLWIVRKNKSAFDANVSAPNESTKLELLEVKPDKQPIGKSDQQHDFTDHRLVIEKGDLLYLFSDGYQDQFGGENGKKLKRSGFKDLVLNLANRSMEHQLEEMDRFFENWKGDYEQVDDVCVIGIKV